jgi:hypothetical protein
VSPGAPDAVPQNTWVHLAGTYDGATVRLYVNGAEVANQRSPAASRTTDARHPGRQRQRRQRRPDRALPGRIDELMLFGRALTANEIAQLAAGAAFPGAADAGAD